jgi:hypothetical protein
MPSSGPSWLEYGNFGNATLISIFQHCVTTIVRHFRGKCYSWDIINVPWIMWREKNWGDKGTCFFYSFDGWFAMSMTENSILLPKLSSNSLSYICCSLLRQPCSWHRTCRKGRTVEFKVTVRDPLEILQLSWVFYRCISTPSGHG